MTYHTPAAAPEPDGTGAVSISELPAESKLVVHGEMSEQRAFGTAIGDPDAAIVTPNYLSPAQSEVDENPRLAGSTILFTPSQSSRLEIEEADAVACGDHNCSQVIFNVGSISKFVHGEADNPMDLNVFLDILRQFLIRAPYIDPVESTCQHVQGLKTCSTYGKNFLKNNTAIINESIQTVFSIPIIYQEPETEDLYSYEPERACSMRTKLISLLHNVTKVEEYYTRGSFIAAAMELSSAAAAFLDFSPDKRSYQRSLDQEVVKLSRYIVHHFAEAVLQELPFTIECLMDLFRGQDLLESAEVMIRHLISQTPPADSRNLLLHDKNLFEVLQKAQSRSGGALVLEDSSQEFVRLSAANLAWTMANQPLFIERNALHLVVKNLRGTWIRYRSHPREEGTDQCEDQDGQRQEIKSLLLNLMRTLRDRGQITPYPDVVVGPKISKLARSFSLLGWYDTSNHFFIAALKYQNRLARLTRIEMIQTYTWQALNHQQQELWQAAVEALRNACSRIQNFRYQSTQFAEFRDIASPLLSALRNFPSGVAETTFLQPWIRRLDQWLASPDDFGTRFDPTVGVTSSRERVSTSQAHTSTSYATTSSSSNWTSSSSSRYGVTYSEGGLSDISHNYSALFG